MKITDLSVLGICILAFALLTSYHKSNTAVNMLENKNIIDRALDNAIDDAAKILVTYDDSRQLVVNKQKALDTFCSTLYANFGVLSSRHSQNILQLYLPVFAVADIDGLYVNYKQKFNTPDGTYYKQMWTEKLPYYYTYGNWTYLFQMNDNLKVINTSTGKAYSGTRTAIQEKLAAIGCTDMPELLADAEAFKRTKSLAITERIEKTLDYYTVNHNKIASDNGITYEFSFALDKGDDYNRAITDVSLYVVFQGYPYSADGTCYNRVAMSAARIKYLRGYWGSKDPMSGEKYYHKYLDNTAIAPCTQQTGVYSKDHTDFSTREDFAEHGYYPCPFCHP